MSTGWWGEAEIPGEVLEGGARSAIERVLEFMLHVFSMLWLLAVFGVVCAFLRPPGDPLRASDWQLDGGPVEAYAVGVPKKIENGAEPVWVVRLDSGTLASVAAVCLHERCALRWDPKASTFRCPCHGGTYDLEGRILSGPALLPLRSFFVHVKAGRVRVHLLRSGEEAR